jgi:hypothetical protein
MTYTFYHCGVLVGESDLEQSSGNPRQRGGVFWPTPYGVQLFPRLSGMLAAAHALKAHLDANGLSADALETGDIEVLFETTPAGQKVIDIGRMLSDVEIRAPDGRRLEIASIAFSDLMEIQRLTRDMQVHCAERIADVPPDAPRYIVSTTLRHETPASARTAQAERFRH